MPAKKGCKNKKNPPPPPVVPLVIDLTKTAVRDVRDLGLQREGLIAAREWLKQMEKTFS